MFTIIAATTTAIAQFYQRGELDLGMPFFKPFIREEEEE